MATTTGYTDADEVRELAKRLIKSRGLNFGEITVGYLFCEVRDTKGVLEFPEPGDDHPKVKRPGREDHAALQDCPDMWVVISRNWWDQADADDWERVVFHALKHIRVNEEGKVFLAKHDVQVWNEEVEFYADDTPALRVLKAHLMQKRLPGTVPTSGGQSARELAEGLRLEVLEGLRDMCPTGKEELTIEHEGKSVTVDRNTRKRLNELIRQRHAEIGKGSANPNA